MARRLLRPVKRAVQGAARRVRAAATPRLGVLFQHPPRPLTPPEPFVGRFSQPAPLISIVTPSYNHAGFLERTLRSVLDQNYPALQYIVQDGGSTDGTPELLERYADRLAYWESARDRGQTHALNLGFGHAEGEILAYLNSDDLLLPGALNYVAHYFQSHPAVDVVYGHRIVIDESGAEVGRWVLPPHDDAVLTWADYVPQETLFWRRRVWEAVGAGFDESFQFAMDWDLLLRFRAVGARFARAPRFLGAFRVHPQSKTSSRIADLGAREMARLRLRCHGRAVSDVEVGAAIQPYLRRHVRWRLMHRAGLLRF
jgi:glycosyltransferase involved in cell wall biosynthesis